MLFSIQEDLEITNPLVGILPRAEFTFRVPEEDGRIHRCLSKRIYRQFPQDSRRPRERPASLCDDWDTSGGEEDRNVSDEDMSELEVSFNLVSTCLAWSEVVCVALMRGNFMNPEPFNSSANIKDE